MRRSIQPLLRQAALLDLLSEPVKAAQEGKAEGKKQERHDPRLDAPGPGSQAETTCRAESTHRESLREAPRKRGGGGPSNPARQCEGEHRLRSQLGA